ncbi:hypothetical protein [Nocardia inohanensis]|uniref:hypothetical protein n=1 Tax=Nocardia inohanensis TaxID=209246 RepID=UPI00082F06E1|nr:hypothetical protein [Nocardia inohanensis]
MTTTLHIDNTVRDYDTWKDVFDKFDRVRADHNVRSCRVSRSADDPGRVLIDLDFDTRAEAETFLETLHKIIATPQSREMLTSHAVLLADVMEQRVPGAAVAS